MLAGQRTLRGAGPQLRRGSLAAPFACTSFQLQPHALSAAFSATVAAAASPRTLQTTRCLQDYLKARHAQIYSTVRYTAIDASPALAASQAARLAAHQERFRTVVADARQDNAWQQCPKVRLALLCTKACLQRALTAGCAEDASGPDRCLGCCAACRGRCAV